MRAALTLGQFASRSPRAAGLKLLRLAAALILVLGGAVLHASVVVAQEAEEAPQAEAVQDQEPQEAEETQEAEDAEAPEGSVLRAPGKVELPPSIARAARRPGTGAWSRADINAVIEQTAARAGLPAEIAEAIVHTESRFNTAAVGADGEIGLMQVMPATARMMGFTGSLADLADPAVNIHYGVNYLAQAYRLAGRDLCTAAMKYRAGHGETRFSYLSVDYCLKVRARLRERGFVVTGIVPAATFGSPLGSSSVASCRGKRCLAGTRMNTNLAALNSRLNQIVFRVQVVNLPRP